MKPPATDPEELPKLLAYRRAYGLAADLVELASMDWAGYDAADLPEPETRRLAERIGAEVRREMGPGADGEAITEAIAGRRPKW